MITRPKEKPVRPYFSSGPCAKPEGWSLNQLTEACLGRSHRSVCGKNRLESALDLTRKALRIPANYRIAIVPGSDTGAFELAMWNLLGERGVEILAFDSFSRDWMYDVTHVLKLADVTCHDVEDGHLPDLSIVNTDHDVVFAWNGTTSGVMIPDSDWIDENRQGLTICDATSAVFAMDMPWGKLDVVTFSWQKALGGEAAHGMLILSPRAVKRIETWQPSWPVPKLFRLMNEGKLDLSLFEGSTINTPSMLCLEDYLCALKWVQDIGGLDAMLQRTQDNFDVISKWVSNSTLVEFLAQDPSSRSPASACLIFVDEKYLRQSDDWQRQFCKDIADLLEGEQVAYDINGYRYAPPGLRIWAGATVENRDITLLMPWLDWAYHEVFSKNLAMTSA